MADSRATVIMPAASTTTPQTETFGAKGGAKVKKRVRESSTVPPEAATLRSFSLKVCHAVNMMGITALEVTTLVVLPALIVVTIAAIAVLALLAALKASREIAAALVVTSAVMVVAIAAAIALLVVAAVIVFLYVAGWRVSLTSSLVT